MSDWQTLLKVSLVENYWHLHVDDKNYKSEQENPPTPFEDNTKSDATARATTTFKNWSAEVTT
eukprot:4402990-Amphidinium_carterae.1